MNQKRGCSSYDLITESHIYWLTVGNAALALMATRLLGILLWELVVLGVAYMAYNKRDEV
jgi:hypothetical protein